LAAEQPDLVGFLREAPRLFTVPVLRYMKTYALTPDEQLAMVSVVQREWAAKNPRATFKTTALPAPRAGAWR
jgi:acetyl-CoA acetyltransferase